MTRKELYDHIRGFGLQDEIKALTGKNYTQVSNEILEEIVSKVIKSKEKCDRINSKMHSKETQCECHSEEEWMVDADEAFVRLVNVLFKKHIILKSEAEFIFQKP